MKGVHCNELFGRIALKNHAKVEQITYHYIYICIYNYIYTGCPKKCIHISKKYELSVYQNSINFLNVIVFTNFIHCHVTACSQTDVHSGQNTADNMKQLNCIHH